MRINQRCDVGRFHDNPVTGRELIVIQNELEKQVEQFLHQQSVRLVKNRTKTRTHTKGALDGQMAGNSAVLQPRMK
jgi:hypothetical protein